MIITQLQEMAEERHRTRNFWNALDVRDVRFGGILGLLENIKS